MGTELEQDQTLYDYVICGYAFLEDSLSHKTLTSWVVVELQVVF